MDEKNHYLKAFRAAFPCTLPVLAGFGFLGLTYGVYMNVSGFGFWYPLLISILVFAGSMQFVAVDILLAAFHPLQAFLLTLMVNARHLFYGISMLEKYRDTGKKKLFLIFGLCDETFSINYSAAIPPDVDKSLFLTFVTLLDYLYWVIASTVGGILGSLVHFSTEGLDFVMTAMFTVIFLEQWLKDRFHISEMTGVLLSVICLLVFGADDFILPAMATILLTLTLLRRPIEKGGDAA